MAENFKKKIGILGSEEAPSSYSKYNIRQKLVFAKFISTMDRLSHTRVADLVCPQLVHVTFHNMQMIFANFKHFGFLTSTGNSKGRSNETTSLAGTPKTY